MQKNIGQMDNFYYKSWIMLQLLKTYRKILTENYKK